MVSRRLPLICMLLAVFVVTGPALAAGPRAPEVGSAPEIDPAILAQMAAAPGGRAEFIVRFDEQAELAPAYAIEDWDQRGRFVYEALASTMEHSQARVRAYLDGLGIAYTPLLGSNALVVAAGPATLQALATFPEVASLRANHPLEVYPVAPAAAPSAESVGWNIAQIHADQVWQELGIRGEGVVVANIDTGVEYTHDALYPNYRCGAGPHEDCWHDATGTCPTAPCDDHGHGTMVMGVVVADDDPTLPYNVGVAPDAQWIACKACTAGGSCSEANLHECAAWLLAPNGDPANRPHVITVSLGGTWCDSWFSGDIQMWRAAGIYPTIAPGGSGPGCGTIGSPADYPEVLATGATDQNDHVSAFSARGPSCFGSIKPEVVAPGIDIRSTIPPNDWSVWSGTSLSSPHSAGLAALIYSADPSLIGNYISTTQAITSTALCITDLSCGGSPCPGGNNVYGWGRIDAYAAVSSLQCQPVAGLDFSWQPPTPIAGQVVTLTASVYGTSPISFSWDLGDGSFVEGPSAIAHRYDISGTYTVVVTATNCTTASQSMSHTVAVVVPPCDPVAGLGLSWQPLTPTVGQVVTLTASVSGTPPISFSWALGDGSVVEGPSTITHSYDVADTYTVAVTATNCTTGSQSVRGTLAVIPPCDPVAGLDFSWEPLTPTAGQAVTLTATAGGTPPFSFTWSLGDGALVAGPPFLTHTYAYPGAYTATLTATNCLGQGLAAAVHAIAVAAPPCEPLLGLDFEWQPLTPTAGQVVTLSAAVSGTPPITFSWTLDDGSAVVGPATITHSFTLPRSYTVVVTATDRCVQALTTVHVVRVVPRPWRIYLPLLLVNLSAEGGGGSLPRESVGPPASSPTRPCCRPLAVTPLT